MITYDTAFGEPVGGTGEQVSDTQIQVHCQSKQNGPGANHQPSEY